MDTKDIRVHTMAEMARPHLDSIHALAQILYALAHHEQETSDLVQVDSEIGEITEIDSRDFQTISSDQEAVHIVRFVERKIIEQ
jgi:hypothetical protein